VLPEALELAQVSAHQYAQYYRAQALAALAPYLPESEKAKVLDEALGLVRALKGALECESERARALMGVLESHSCELLPEALALAQAVEDQYFRYLRAEALAALAPCLPQPVKGEVLDEALRLARALKNALTSESDEVKELARMVLFIPHPWDYRTVAPRLVFTDSFRYLQVLALAALWPHLLEPLKGEVLPEALAAARALKEPQQRAEVLTVLAPHLPKPLPSEVLEAALALKPQQQAEMLTALVPYLPESMKDKALDEALVLVQVLKDEYYRACALTALGPFLPEPLKDKVLGDALQLARALEEPQRRATVLTALAPRLPEPVKSDVLHEALGLVRVLQWPHLQEEVLTALVPDLPEPLLPEALAAARAVGSTIDWPQGIPNPHWARALGALIPRLPEPMKSEVLPEALAAARALVHPAYRARTLGALVLHLPEPLKSEILPEALAAARALAGRDRAFHAAALARLVPHLPESLKGEVLSEAVMVALGMLVDRDRRAKVLSRLAPQLAELPPASLYPLWRETLHLQATHGRQYLLSDQRALTPVLVKLGGVEAATETTRAILDVGQWWP
jgi:hypothetical protein